MYQWGSLQVGHPKSNSIVPHRFLIFKRLWRSPQTSHYCRYYTCFSEPPHDHCMDLGFWSLMMLDFDTKNPDPNVRECSFSSRLGRQHVSFIIIIIITIIFIIVIIIIVIMVTIRNLIRMFTMFSIVFCLTWSLSSSCLWSSSSSSSSSLSSSPPSLSLPPLSSSSSPSLFLPLSF